MKQLKQLKELNLDPLTQFFAPPEQGLGMLATPAQMAERKLADEQEEFQNQVMKNQKKTQRVMASQSMDPILSIVQPKKSSIADTLANHPFLQQMLPGLEAQQKGIDQRQLEIDKYGKDFVPEQDLSSVLGATDWFTGSQFAKNYKKPETAEERMLKKMGLTKDLQKDKDSLTDKQNDALKIAAMFENDQEKNKAMMKIASMKSEASGDNFTPGEKKIDQDFAERLGDYSLGGGAQNLSDQLKVLEKAAEYLEAGKGTGKIYGMTPDGLRALTAPEARAMQQDIEKNIQASMKQTLGAQFTAKEGENVLRRTFDPALPPEENARRVRNIIAEFKARGVAIENAQSYFQNNRSLRGMDYSKISKPYYGPGGQTTPAVTPDKLSSPAFLKWKAAKAAKGTN